MADLREARWIATDPWSSCSVLLGRSCAIAGYEPHIVGDCGDFSVTSALVAAGTAMH